MQSFRVPIYPDSCVYKITLDKCLRYLHTQMYNLLTTNINCHTPNSKKKKKVTVGDTSSINIQHIIQQHQLELAGSQSSLCWHLLLLTKNRGHTSALSVHIDFKFKSIEGQRDTQIYSYNVFHSSRCTLKILKCNSKYCERKSPTSVNGP